MKATEEHFPMVLFIMPYKVVLIFESLDEILNVTIQMKATEQYFPVVLVIMLCGTIHFTISLKTRFGNFAQFRAFRARK